MRRDCGPLGAAGFACAFEETLPGVSTMFVPACGATVDLRPNAEQRRGAASLLGDTGGGYRNRRCGNGIRFQHLACAAQSMQYLLKRPSSLLDTAVPQKVNLDATPVQRCVHVIANGLVVHRRYRVPWTAAVSKLWLIDSNPLSTATEVTPRIRSGARFTCSPHKPEGAQR